MKQTVDKRNVKQEGVPVINKWLFLNWFYKTQPINDLAILFLVEFLYRNEDLLSRIHFVSREVSTERFVKISLNSAGEGTFCYTKENTPFAHTNVLMKDLLLPEKSDYYIQFDFTDLETPSYYSEILIEEGILTSLSSNELSDIERFIQYQEWLNEKRYISKLVDEAIDNNDIEKLKQLSIQLNELNKNERWMKDYENK